MDDSLLSAAQAAAEAALRVANEQDDRSHPKHHQQLLSLSNNNTNGIMPNAAVAQHSGHALMGDQQSLAVVNGLEGSGVTTTTANNSMNLALQMSMGHEQQLSAKMPQALQQEQQVGLIQNQPQQIIPPQHLFPVIDDESNLALQRMFAEQSAMIAKQQQEEEALKKQQLERAQQQQEQRRRMLQQQQRRKQQLQMQRQQQQQQQQQQELQRRNQGPQKQYMTMAQNGTILESTRTITGAPPEALLMTSTFDTVYEDDLPGYMCVKTHFWDKGHGNVPAVIRRPHAETGKLIWMTCKAIQYIHQPVAGFVMEEEVVESSWAAEVARKTRITAILIQAVEASLVSKPEPPAIDAIPQNKSLSATTQGDAEAYRSLLESFESTGVGPADAEVLNDLIAAAGSVDGENQQLQQQQHPQEPGEKFDQEAKANNEQRKNFDPLTIIDSVRQGVRLDLGMSTLLLDELRMIALVLSGKVPVDQVAPVVLTALQNGESLKSAFAEFALESERTSPVPRAPTKFLPPPLAVVNLSYTYIGNEGIDILSEVLYQEGCKWQTLDVSFCNIEEKGFISLAKGFAKRRKRNIRSLRGLIVSGNYLSSRAASDLGAALAKSLPRTRQRKRPRSMSTGGMSSGYDTEDSDEDEFDEDDDGGDDGFGAISGRKRSNPDSASKPASSGTDPGLQVLHIAHCSMSATATSRLLSGLGAHCTVRELNLASNYFRSSGATVLANFLEGKRRSEPAMPNLDRLDLSDNILGDDGTTQLARVIAKRSSKHLVDLKLSSNSVGAGGIESLMNKLLQHNLLSLSLNKNNIGDQGCQLVAASIQSMKSLARLNLGFNQIGCRGINSLMRSLVGCESITYLGLSGNILRISGAISLAFTLSQHPRLEELDLDNCCLGQAAQCHIAAGAISNRYVPMKRMNGFAVGPPMVAIGALEPFAQGFSNEKCFQLRKDEQMKTMLQWRKTNQMAKQTGDGGEAADESMNPESAAEQRFLSPDFVANMNGTPSQNAYYRLLGWLSRIPFDDDELATLQKYFYDADGGEGDRGSDGYINLKLRGDLLAALDSEVADEIREEFPSLASSIKHSIGYDLDKGAGEGYDAWKAFKGDFLDASAQEGEEAKEDASDHLKSAESDMELDNSKEINTSSLSASKPGISQSKSDGEERTVADRKIKKVDPRILTFPGFEQQLEELQSTAKEMIKQEEDTMQHEVILTQFAEYSLTILRQLRYFCMHIGLDGWRQVGEHRQKRKVLVVDDSRVTRKLVSRAFEKANFIVDTANNGSEGVERMKSSIYDITFMDIDMPVMNGFEATKQLREWEDAKRPGCRQPICALTAQYVDDFSKAELMKFKEAGLDVMESKPCNIPRLLKVVDDVSPMFSDLSVKVVQRDQTDPAI